MRFSIERGDRAYDPAHSRRIKHVKIDGKVVQMALTADTTEGLVRHVAAGPDGMPIVHNGEMTILESRGKVEIELLDAEKRWDKERKGEAKVGVARAANGDLLVQVYSLARPGAIKQVRKEYITLPRDPSGICQCAGVLAGYAAELLCDQFGDSLDPSECARVAVEQAHHMVKDDLKPSGYDAYEHMDMG